MAPPIKREDDPVKMKFFAFQSLTDTSLPRTDTLAVTGDLYAANDVTSPDKMPGSGLNPTASMINARLKELYAESNHIVQIESTGNELWYVLSRKNDPDGSRSIRLTKFDGTIPYIDEGFLALPVTDSNILLQNNGYSRAVELSGTDNFSGKLRYIVIPKDIHDDILNGRDNIKVDLERAIFKLSKEKGVETYTFFDVRNSVSDKTALYLLNIWPAGDYEKPGQDMVAEIPEQRGPELTGQSAERRGQDVSPKPRPKKDIARVEDPKIKRLLRESDDLGPEIAPFLEHEASPSQIDGFVNKIVDTARA